MISNSLEKFKIINFNEYNSKKYNNSKKHSSKRKINIKKRLMKNICITSILLTCFLASYNNYININSKDLSFSIEYNLTKGFPSNKKLFRVKSISLIESKNSTAIVKVSGLSKSTPHKTISILANFQKESDVWILKHVY